MRCMVTTMNEETLDIVEELNAWADIIDKSKGKAQVVMLTGEVFVDAAAEIAMLRTLVRNLSTQKLEHDTKVRKMQLDHLTTLGELQEAAAENERLREQVRRASDRASEWKLETYQLNAELDDERAAVRRLGVKVKTLTSAGDALSDAVLVSYGVALPTLPESAQTRLRDAHSGWQRAAVEADRG